MKTFLWFQDTPQMLVFKQCEIKPNFMRAVKIQNKNIKEINRA